jgi:hypothetical protein
MLNKIKEIPSDLQELYNYYKSDELHKSDEIINELLDKQKIKVELTDTILTKLTNELKQLDVNDYMIAFDYNSLYPSAMSHINSEYPKAESARVFDKSREKQEFLELFNSRKFRPKCGIFHIEYFNPKDLILQHLTVKDNVKIDKSNGEVNRFRNGLIRDTLNSVDIDQIVRCGGRITDIYSGIVYEENFQESPFKSFIHKLYNKRIEFKKEGNKVASDMVKLPMNGLYGRTIMKDINHTFHIWGESTLMRQYDENVMSLEQLKSGKYVVQRKQDIGVDVTKSQYKQQKTVNNQTREVPNHLGSYILAHSKRLMNDILETINAYKSPTLYYTDTDSTYIMNSDYKKLVEAKLVGNDLFQGKNDIDDDGKILYGMFIAPKIKWNLVIDNKGKLIVKKTFKGFTRDVLTSEQFFRLADGQEVTEWFPKTWEKSFSKGVKFMDVDKLKNEQNEEEKKKVYTKKNFQASVNLLKRKAPDSNGIMLPYFIKSVPWKKSESIPIDDNDNQDVNINLETEDLKYMLFDAEIELVGSDI